MTVQTPVVRAWPDDVDERLKRRTGRILYVRVSTRIKPSVKSPKSGILVTEVITFDEIAPWVILGRS